MNGQRTLELTAPSVSDSEGPHHSCRPGHYLAFDEPLGWLTPFGSGWHPRWGPLRRRLAHKATKIVQDRVGLLRRDLVSAVVITNLPPMLKWTTAIIAGGG